MYYSRADILQIKKYSSVRNEKKRQINLQKAFWNKSFQQYFSQSQSILISQTAIFAFPRLLELKS
jgi:hypothetical protein